MKLEYIFMGYIVFVIGRFYCCIIRDLLRYWQERSEGKSTRTEGRIFSYHR
jgi:hypothetical protein